MALPAADRSLLRRVPLFAELAEDDLDWIARACSMRELGAGEVVAAEGDRGDAMYVITAGELEVVKRSRTADIPLARLGPGEIVGEMAVLEDAPRNATVRAVEASRVIRISREVVLELVRTRPSAAMSMIRTVTGRLRSTESLLREREKLAALGTLSAGLAHELNNPAAAVQRSSGLLRQALKRWAAATRDLGAVVSDARRAAVIGDLGAQIPSIAGSYPADPLEAGDREEDLERLFADHDVPQAADLAASLASTGWTLSDLEPTTASFDGTDLGVVQTGHRIVHRDDGTVDAEHVWL